MASHILGINIDELKDILKIRLSKKRYTHSLNVADAAVKLAEKYKLDSDSRLKCQLAGLAHDICKEIPPDEQLVMGKACFIPLSPVEEKIPALYHAAAGAYYCEKVLGITDEEVLSAVRFHTAARDNMSKVEEIIYLADLISDDRSYKDVSRMRKLAFDDLNTAMLESLKFAISDVMAKGSLVPESTSRAYNQYALAAKTKTERKI